MKDRQAGALVSRCKAKSFGPKTRSGIFSGKGQGPQGSTEPIVTALVTDLTNRKIGFAKPPQRNHLVADRAVMDHAVMDHLASGRSMPDVQQEFAEGCGILFFNQQRAFGPCTPGCTAVQATHSLSALHRLWHRAQSSDGSST